MTAYIVVQVNVQDAARYDEYSRLVPDSLKRYGGRFRVRGGATEILEGTWQPARLVILDFDSVAKARAWWESDEYAEAKALRQACAGTEMILVDGAD